MLRKFFSLCLCFLLGSCFDYQELVFFHSNFSGYVEYNYRVPLYPDQDRSIIAFLPVMKSRILSKYRNLLVNKQITINSFFVEMQSTGLPIPENQKDAIDQKADDTEIFKRFARVRYKIHFKNPVVLEQILPGEVQIRWRSNKYLQITRKFPVAGGLSEKSDRLLQRIYKLSRDTLQGKEMIFQIQFPVSHILKSNLGRATENQQLNYILPLEKSLNELKPITWIYSLHLK